ncbi:MAG TPA: hypothetical protein VMU67_13880 [Steroidobacteraceae bacterium]|nr:hypothetical protein [Steroidobacteraceae bacterium]
MPADAEAARAALREALGTIAPAQAAHEEARAAVARAQAVIDAAADAERELAAAEARASEAARAWAAAGAREQQPADRAVFDAAAVARRAAEDARLRAAGAAAAMHELRERESLAAGALSHARLTVNVALTELLYALGERHRALLARLLPQVAEAQLALEGLRYLTSKWGPAHPYGRFTAAGVGPRVAADLAQLVAQPPSAALVEVEAERWAEVSERLLARPEGDIDV